MKIVRSILAGAAVVAVSLGMSACGGNGKAESEPASSTTELTVFAAKSLTKAFTQIDEEIFRQEHPDISIKFSFDGSNTLVKQIAEGAPVDVLATADQKNMDNAVEQDLVEDVQPFASNVLTLIVPSGNPANITGLDESLDGTKLVVCAEGVPCGNATRTLAENLGVALSPVSEEKNVGDVRSKVEKGEADAGLVYVTDARSSGDKVEIIEVLGAEDVVNAYPIALVKGTKNSDAAKAFIATVLSPEGQKILADYGFKGAELADKG
ncbi:MAG: molybdate ABC transporter substrate-binding protein [Actinomycetaceae bacterium]|nr:molybdate ABC transporter substrate-binding protein [Actinomycetaceae bacterium]